MQVDRIVRISEEDYIGDELLPEDMVPDPMGEISDDDFDKFILNAMGIQADTQRVLMTVA